MQPHRLSSLLLIYGCVIAYPSSVAAQITTAEKASAEFLFDEGLTLMKKGQFKDACPKLENSQRIEPAVGTLLYLAECYERIGRVSSAWVTFREAASLARASAQPQRASIAQARADRAKSEIAILTIEIPPEVRSIAGLAVRCGPVSVNVALESVDVPLDPGEVTLEATAPGYLTFSRQVHIETKGRSRIVISALEPLPSRATEVASPSRHVSPAIEMGTVSTGIHATAPPPTRSSPGFHRPIPVTSIALGGLGLVGLGIGTYFGLSAISKASDARTICPNGTCTEQRGETLMNDARSAARLSNVTIGLGATALAAGLVLYLIRPEHASAQTASLGPMAGQNHIGIEWQGRL
jgi:serine/threonine-protein kinase